jgi:ubiquinone/menaquinone biosynthesis C-methylase UbiE
MTSRDHSRGGDRVSNFVPRLEAAKLGKTLTRSRSGGERRLRTRGVTTTPAYDAADIRSFFDQCAASGFAEQHGHPRRLLEYRLGLVRSLAQLRPSDVVLDVGCGNGHHLLALGSEIARGTGVDLSPGMIASARAGLGNSPSQAGLKFQVDDAEALKEISDQSIDLAICIGTFEHILDKQAMLASVYRVLKADGRFFCLTLNADYVWYRTIAPLLGYATKHLSSDRLLTRNELAGLLDEVGFHRVGFSRWTFIPRGDMPAAFALLLVALDAIGRRTRLNSLRGGLAACAWKQASQI